MATAIICLYSSDLLYDRLLMIGENATQAENLSYAFIALSSLGASLHTVASTENCFQCRYWWKVYPLTLLPIVAGLLTILILFAMLISSWLLLVSSIIVLFLVVTLYCRLNGELI